MCNGEKRRARANGRKPSSGATVKLQLRRPAAAHDFDVAPQDLLSVTGSERLHRRFLCREAAGKMDGRISPTLAVRDLAVGEDAADKPLSVTFDCRRDARDICRIEAKAN